MFLFEQSQSLSTKTTMLVSNIINNLPNSVTVEEPLSITTDFVEIMLQKMTASNMKSAPLKSINGIGDVYMQTDMMNISMDSEVMIQVGD